MIFLEKTSMTRLVRHVAFGLIPALALGMSMGAAQAQVLNEDCTANVLNRRIQVNPNGTFAIGNVPISFGAFRVRIVCERPSGLTERARSDFLLGVRGGVTEITQITFGDDEPIPVALRLTTPVATVDVDLGKAPRLGEATATVGIVEFTDYQCPFCKRFHDQTFSKLKAQYIDTGKIQYVVRDFPLAFHGQATRVAVAAHCAQAQGEYWTMHHELFTNQRRLGPALYEELAGGQGLDPQQFAACLTDPARAQSVDADLAYGKTMGVRGTPNFFIGRIDLETGILIGARRLSGAQPFETFSRALAPLLAP